MIRAPGYVSDLGPNGQRGWEAYIGEILNGVPGQAGVISEATQANGGVAPSVLLDGDPALQPGLVPVDWQGYPVRVKQTLNQSDTKLDPFIDWTRAGETLGRATCHEEYLEWRTVRRADGKIVRVELTTETPDYWAKLARYEPRKVVELAAKFAGETTDKVDVPELFGIADPFSVDAFTPDGENVERAFKLQNWSINGRIRGAYNNGTKSILHMSQSVNSVNAAVALAVFAAYPHGKQAGSTQVALSGPEAIEATAQAAVNCRNSDPTIVGVAVETVFGGSKVALMEAIGLYLVSVNQAGLTFADGSSVPQNWFSYERGSRGANNPTGVDLFQRLVVEAPPGNGNVVGDLIDEDGKPVKSGTQIARLINVGLYLRKTAVGVVAAPRNIVMAPVVPPCHGNGSGTDNFKALWQKYTASPAPVVPALRRN